MFKNWEIQIQENLDEMVKKKFDNWILHMDFLLPIHLTPPRTARISGLKS